MQFDIRNPIADFHRSAHKDRYQRCLRRSVALVLTVVWVQSIVAAEPDTLADSCWTESFVDNFDTLSLWDAATGKGRWKTSYIWDRDVTINNELQYYADPREHGVVPFSIREGILTIQADEAPRSLREKTGQPYTSGVLTTQKDFNQKYGRFEARIRVPPGQGLWPAFWLLPSFEQWPAGIAVLPEIDVMEFLGHEPTTYHTTLHTNQTGELTSHPYAHNVGLDLTESFHVYSVVWNQDELTWYFDGKAKARHMTPRDFTKPVHFLLNLAVGGNWPGEPTGKTRFPAQYEIDYVKAWTPSGEC